MELGDSNQRLRRDIEAARHDLGGLNDGGAETDELLEILKTYRPGDSVDDERIRAAHQVVDDALERQQFERSFDGDTKAA